jgi:pSer/pThr/pTyr-binding forkhead associated (FHA) protein
MIVCPSCYHQEYVGALFCSKCGAQLTYQSKSPTETVQYPEAGEAEGAPAETHAISSSPRSLARVSIKIFETGQVIPLEGSEEFTIGRVSGTQPILPDIDLTPYKAYQGGVSRLHAILRTAGEQVTISDLGSANGTHVNGVRIPAYELVTLTNGDILSFGKFQMEIIIR